LLAKKSSWANGRVRHAKRLRPSLLTRVDPTDKGYITHTEWVRDFGGTTKRKEAEYKRVPFACCALSLAPFVDAVCTEEGVVFDPK